MKKLSISMRGIVAFVGLSAVALAVTFTAIQQVGAKSVDTSQLRAEGECPETLDYTVKALAEDKEVNLCQTYRGKVVLIVNTASKCGYTPQYDGLEALYDTYREKGLVVLGFPSNDFAGQEPGTEKQIQDFCRLTYGVKFPMFAKTSVSEANAHPLFKTLAGMAAGYPQWNFHKYLLDRNGKLVASYPSKVAPQSDELVGAIEKLL